MLCNFGTRTCRESRENTTPYADLVDRFEWGVLSQGLVREVTLEIKGPSHQIRLAWKQYELNRPWLGHVMLNFKIFVYSPLNLYWPGSSYATHCKH